MTSKTLYFMLKKIGCGLVSNRECTFLLKSLLLSVSSSSEQLQLQGGLFPNDIKKNYVMHNHFVASH